MPQNSFAVDKQGVNALDSLGLTPQQKATLLDQLLQTVPVGREIDLSKPIVPPYRYQEYPKIMYRHEDGGVLRIENQAQEKAAVKRGFELTASDEYDYSKIHNGRAQKKAVGPVREPAFSPEELEALDQEDTK